MTPHGKGHSSLYLLLTVYEADLKKHQTLKRREGTSVLGEEFELLKYHPVQS